MNNFNRGGGFGNRKSGGFNDRKGGGGFDRRDSGGRDFGRGGNSFGKPTMHQATCADCGQSCEVPFKPTGDRPVYCSNCFKGKDDSNSNRGGGRDSAKSNFNSSSYSKPEFTPRNNNSGPSNEQFEKLNAKLDKILSILNSALEEEDEEIDEPEEFRKEKELKISVPKEASKKSSKKAVAPKATTKKRSKK